MNPTPASRASSTRPRGANLSSRRMAYPRKRAVTACEHCRARKIKFDPASLLILEKLHQVLQKLDQQSAVTANGPIGRSDCVLPPPPAAADADDLQPSPASLALDGLHIPSSFSSPDWVVDWPIFDKQFRRGCLLDELFIAERSSSQALEDTVSVSRSRGTICADDIPGLVTRFLHFVHIKNPILDPKAITQLASRLAEDGVGWDRSSCLVLLACALGAIATPFDHRTGTVQQPDPGIQSDPATAENFYQLACRRLGLLDQSAIAAQCYLLSGIYLMYTMRPLQAQSRFFQASSIYAIYLKGQVAVQQQMGLEDDPLQSINLRLEQCLYWTCFKSECEIRQEFDTPVSGLAALAYPHMFPCPPTPDQAINDELGDGNESIPTPASNSSLLSLTHGTLREVEEQSWYYYLSEIALRRIANRVWQYFYQEDHTSWSHMNIYTSAAVVGDLEMQLENWNSTVPSNFRGLSTSDGSEELGTMIRGRYIGLKSYLYRPFLYYVIHHPDCKPETYRILEPLAMKAITTIIESITFGRFYHRHHGTWFCCREVTSYALLLLAAHKSGLTTSGQLDSPHEGLGYAELVKICVDVLRYWQADSPDIAKSREVVELLRDQILREG
ncbi:hypothetical protein BJY01DRAFT_236758 [Aspergillus pseudoustus]|uniref:Transcription factor domain-containing protein n=1 Tax=Aspergillus pseudoustus TaxID=1810923 RepID=A0ABR4JK29_9EURO